jgi:inhibitor of cysteine peptidase
MSALVVGAGLVGAGLLNRAYPQRSDERSDAERTNPKMIHVDETYSGRTVVLAVGEILQITLAENRTTGFQWNVKSDSEPACMLILDEPQGAAGPPGKAGTHRWQYRGVRSGTGEIKLEYRRPWEKDTPPGKTFGLRVRVP